ncbi:MAG TPA: FAD-binding oxidoreductase [Candidatus Eisenbacteria bacterium]|jgi:FAD/FMN-containing dehydrogenase|nr:FAD-binding oxidoreductase [Candidatus Eisenbacteria bacterium]
MSTAVTLKTRDGGSTALSPQDLDQLRARLRGAVCLPGEPGYEQARTLWNAMIDRKPAITVRALGAADVITAVRFAREHGLLLAVRGGGHNIAGNAVCDGGLQLDLSLMRSVRVDPVSKTARVEPGAVLGDVDKETQTFGLALPVGVNSTTGISGLTLGGGFGWLSRKYGLTIDNLLSVDLVTANGALVHASEKENPDLFWAVRGGGGNFGVVTSFEFRLHAIGTELLTGVLIHPLDKAKEILTAYRRVVAQAPDELAVWFVMRKAPPLPFLAPEYHGTDVLVLAMCWSGDPEAGRGPVGQIQGLGKPIAEVVGPMPFVAWQQLLDPLLTPGARNYWKSQSFTELTDAALDVLVDAAKRIPSAESEIAFAQVGGAINRVPAASTAYPHRNIQFVLNEHTRWMDPAKDKECIAWARKLFDDLTPHATGGVYVNFMPEEETLKSRPGAYGTNMERLAQIKAKLDPDNLFRMNQNITPAAR